MKRSSLSLHCRIHAPSGPRRLRTSSTAKRALGAAPTIQRVAAVEASRGGARAAASASAPLSRCRERQPPQRHRVDLAVAQFADHGANRAAAQRFLHRPQQVAALRGGNRQQALGREGRRRRGRARRARRFRRAPCPRRSRKRGSVRAPPARAQSPSPRRDGPRSPPRSRAARRAPDRRRAPRRSPRCRAAARAHRRAIPAVFCKAAGAGAAASIIT